MGGGAQPETDSRAGFPAWWLEAGLGVPAGSVVGKSEEGKVRNDEERFFLPLGLWRSIWGSEGPVN